MRCPYCNHNEDKVIDSRETANGTSIRRRRECINCGKRFTTYEYIEKTPLMVVKKDGRREPFNREKIISGLIRACQKRNVSVESLDKLAWPVRSSAASRHKS